MKKDFLDKGQKWQMNPKTLNTVEGFEGRQKIEKFLSSLFVQAFLCNIVPQPVAQIISSYINDGTPGDREIMFL